MALSIYRLLFYRRFLVCVPKASQNIVGEVNHFHLHTVERTVAGIKLIHVINYFLYNIYNIWSYQTSQVQTSLQYKE